MPSGRDPAAGCQRRQPGAPLVGGGNATPRCSCPSSPPPFLLHSMPMQVASDAWKTTLDAVVPAVVVLKVTQTRAFDTESAGSSYATGFVVDKARGLILTNRHVVTPGRDPFLFLLWEQAFVTLTLLTVPEQHCNAA